MTPLSNRTAALRPSATNAAAARARVLVDSGHDVIDFGRGELDFDPPPCVVEAVLREVREHRIHHYGPPAGMPELRDLVATQWSHSGQQLGANQVLIANGTKHALWQAILTIVDPGDEVLLPCPYWTSYPSLIDLAGGRAVTVPSSSSQQYKITPEVLEQFRSDRTKAIVFVSPANPSGAVYSDAEARAIGRWAVDNNIAVISDDIYADIVYPPHIYTPITELVPDLADLCVRAGGIGKSYAMTGWRIGWLTGPKALIDKATALQSHTSGHPSNISQIAAIAALTDGHGWLKNTVSILDQRRRILIEGLDGVPGLACVEPAGAFYAFVDTSALHGHDVNGRTVGSSAELAEILIDEAHIATVPGEAFGMPEHLRFSFALSPSDIRTGLDRLADTLNQV